MIFASPVRRSDLSCGADALHTARAAPSARAGSCAGRVIRYGNAAEPVKRAVEAMEAAVKALGEPDELSRTMRELAKPPGKPKK